MQISVVHNRIARTILIDKPGNLLKILQTFNIPIQAACGGQGTCGKCRVEIDGIGSVLACKTILNEKLWQEAGVSCDQMLYIRLPERGSVRIQSEGRLAETVLDPLPRRGEAHLRHPRLSDQCPDVERFQNETGLYVPFTCMNALSDLLHRSRQSDSPDGNRSGRHDLNRQDALTDTNKYETTLHYVYRQDTHSVIRFLDSADDPFLGMVVDIGTTTLAAFLYDLSDGQRLATAGMMNPQTSFGADVLSRIDFAEQSSDHPHQLRQRIAQAIADLLTQLCDRSGYAPHVVDVLACCGNSTMLHLFMGLNPGGMARAPFIPVTLAARELTAEALSLPSPLRPDLICLMLPGISAYVGSDITAGILACRLDQIKADHKDQQILLVDIGTNGEMVLAGPDGLCACSAAAGPAFEAANIQCGMPGLDGAIDQVGCQDGNLKITWIGQDNPDCHPRGICGTGLVSAVAAFLDQGILDETGRFTAEPELLPHDLACRMQTVNGQTVIYLTDSQLDSSQAVFLTQKDIRELQNAKAAMAAGIQVLLDKKGLGAEDLTAIYLAGGFGSCLQPEHAERIGLLPAGSTAITQAVGNAAAMGTVRCLLNETMRQSAAKLVQDVEYIELSAEAGFTDLYIEAMLFPEGD